ncbi:MAG: oligosaccharide flippase family protein [Anaerolineae bacterium]|nr:oligosaccharide flippase family protein [Anaerolineae bacterium]
MNLVKRVASGILWAQIGKVAETVLAFLLSVVVIRQLGPEAYGEYGLLLAIIGLGILFSSLGFRQILGKHVPRLVAEKNLSGAKFLLRWMLGWRIGLTLFMIVVFLTLAGVLASLFGLTNLNTYRWPLVLLFLSQNLYLLPIAFFNATLGMKRVLIVNLVLWSASLAFTLILFQVHGVSVLAVLYASALATMLSFAVGLLLTRNWLGGGDSVPLPTEPLWRFGATVWLTDLANFGLDTQTDVLFMGYFLADKAQIGFYRAAVMPVQRLMGFLFGAWSGLTMPVLSESHAAHGSVGIRRAWTGYVKLITVLAIPLLVLLAALAEPVLKLLYSDQFVHSAGLLQLYALFSVFGFAVGHGLSTGLLQTLDQEALALRLRLLACGLNVLLNALLIPRWGATGALVATGLAGILLWFIETVIVIRQCDLRYPWGFLIKVLLASLVAAVVARLLSSGGWVELIAGGAIFALIFLGLCYLLKPLSEQDKAALVSIDPRMRRLICLL